MESQLIQNDPPEVRTALAHLLEQGVDRHSAIHLITEGVLGEIHSAATRKSAYDADRYRHHLEQLSRARTRGAGVGPQVGRNDPCPCGSGKKYKRCCGGIDAPAEIDPRRTRMILGAGGYATGRYLEQVPQGDPMLYLENLAAVVQAMERVGAQEPAAEGHRRLVTAAEAVGEDALAGALHDQIEFALNNPEHAADGIAAANRLIALAESEEEVAQLRLDVADLLEGQGESDQADALYREVMAADPPDPHCHLRWARRLADTGRQIEAKAVYRRLIERKGLGDPGALYARSELAEL